MSEFILEIDNLTIDVCQGSAHHRRRLVDHLSLKVPQGKTVAIVGASGAGKSMTSLAVMGVLPNGIEQTGGDIVLKGKNLGNCSSEEMRMMRNSEVSMIMQNPMSAFDPVFTIRSHFSETLKSHDSQLNARDVNDKAHRALLETGFSNPQAILDIYPFQMSGGMLQRVMIALALISNPSLVIADEATTDLDVVSQAMIINLLRERREKLNLSVLLITHDLSVAANFADEVVVVHQGRVVEAGSVQSVYTNPQKPYTQQLLAAHLNLYQGVFADVLEQGYQMNAGAGVVHEAH